MPVLKFRSVEEMPPPSWCDQVDAPCIDRIRKLWRRSALFSPRNLPKGVIKYRSIEEAQTDRERWLTEHVQGLQRKRAKKGILTQRRRGAEAQSEEKREEERAPFRQKRSRM